MRYFIILLSLTIGLINIQTIESKAANIFSASKDKKSSKKKKTQAKSKKSSAKSKNNKASSDKKSNNNTSSSTKSSSSIKSKSSDSTFGKSSLSQSPSPQQSSSSGRKVQISVPVIITPKVKINQDAIVEATNTSTQSLTNASTLGEIEIAVNTFISDNSF